MGQGKAYVNQDGIFLHIDFIYQLIDKEITAYQAVDNENNRHVVEVLKNLKHNFSSSAATVKLKPRKGWFS